MRYSRRQTLRVGFSYALCLSNPLRGYAAQDPLVFKSDAASIALALLQGAIRYVDGTPMLSAMGEVDIGDVKTWTRDALAELEAFAPEETRGQLFPLVMDNLAADLGDVINKLRWYASLTDQTNEGSKNLLYGSDKSTGSLILLASYYDQAIFICAAAMALRLFTIYALYNADNNGEHIMSSRVERRLCST